MFTALIVAAIWVSVLCVASLFGFVLEAGSRNSIGECE